MIQLDGTDLLLPPEEMVWELPDPFITAAGNPAYPSVMRFTMKFSGLTPQQFAQLVSFYNSHKYDYGTASLPSYADASVYQTYSVIPQLPSFDRFFEGYYLGVTFVLEVML